VGTLAAAWLGGQALPHTMPCTLTTRDGARVTVDDELAQASPVLYALCSSGNGDLVLPRGDAATLSIIVEFLRTLRTDPLELRRGDGELRIVGAGAHAGLLPSNPEDLAALADAATRLQHLGLMMLCQTQIIAARWATR